jgi:predicted SAM-dependent methyltransferase
MKMKLLNIGCGDVFHSDWTNIDMISFSNQVMVHDLRKGLPFVSESFDAVYHSHVLEHIKRHDVSKFLLEIKRVLKPGGVMRVVVPDLENIARAYLHNIENHDRREWMTIELIDQMTRTEPGGQMKVYLEKGIEKEFVLSRIGDEAKKIWEISKTETTNFKKYLKKIKHKFKNFRDSGEIHQWMYDRYSMKKLLEDNGFANIKSMTALDSQIPSFESYQLDSVSGKVRKPDSLFMECLK